MTSIWFGKKINVNLNSLELTRVSFEESHSFPHIPFALSLPRSIYWPFQPVQHERNHSPAIISVEKLRKLEF
jgi:hypothetical protein